MSGGKYQRASFQELIERARADDRGAFEELFKRSQPMLEILAARSLGRVRLGIAGSSDITQDTAHLASQKFADFLGSTEGQWNAWLKAILLNCIAQSYRAAHQQKRDDSNTLFLDDPKKEPVPGREKSPSQSVAQDEKCVQLLAHLSQLQGRQGEAILLHHLQGVPVVQVAKAMKKSPAAIRGLLKRGIQKLQGIIDNDLPVDSKNAPLKSRPTKEAANAYSLYLRLRDAGKNVDREAFVVKHPTCASELRAMFALIERIQTTWAGSSGTKK